MRRFGAILRVLDVWETLPLQAGTAVVDQAY